MKNVFILIGSLILGSLLIQQLITGSKRKKITSREDDPSIPPVSSHAF